MFIETGYTVLRKAVPPLFCRFVAEQYNMMLSNDMIPYDEKHGERGNLEYGVEQSYYAYALPVTEALLTMLLPTVAKEIGAELLPTYSYSRVYLKGAQLKRHTDRPNCEVSVTLAVAGQAARPWPIFLQSKDGQTVEVALEAGDMLIYAGPDMPHWREPFDGDWQLQVFLHYVRKNGLYADRVFDGRPRLGAPKILPGGPEASP